MAVEHGCCDRPTSHAGWRSGCSQVRLREDRHPRLPGLGARTGGADLPPVTERRFAGGDGRGSGSGGEQMTGREGEKLWVPRRLLQTGSLQEPQARRLR